MRRLLAPCIALALALTAVPWGLQAPAPARAAVEPAVDFDDDGFGDLVIPVPAENTRERYPNAGGVQVLYGTDHGFTPTGNQFLTQGEAGLLDFHEEGDFFGAAVAVGDFNEDGYSDLAAGAPGESVIATKGAGAVMVIYGSARRLARASSQFFTQQSFGIEDDPEEGDGFGAALVAGDFDGDGFDDLAIGAPHEDLGTVADAGSVTVIYGSDHGLQPSGDPALHTLAQVFTQNRSGVEDTAEPGDFFGATLATADLGRGGQEDLVIGAPLEDVGATTNAGAVHVIYGSEDGLQPVDDQQWTQASRGIADDPEPGDSFGWSLAVGDVNGDELAELAIGVPYEDLGSIVDAGAVEVLYAGSSGLGAAGSQIWTQANPGVADDPERSDLFGAALAAGDFGGNPFGDLAIGVPLEDTNGVHNTGAVCVLYGADGRLGAAGNDTFGHQTAGIPGTGQADEQLGFALAPADPASVGVDSLVVGVPHRDVAAKFNAGAAIVLKPSSEGVVPPKAPQTWTQDAAGIWGGAEPGDYLMLAGALGGQLWILDPLTLKDF